jgi:hypothetical protein
MLAEQQPQWTWLGGGRRSEFEMYSVKSVLGVWWVVSLFLVVVRLV